MNDLAIYKLQGKDLLHFYKIYRNSFQKGDRFSLPILLFNIFRKKAKCYVAKKDHSMIGFIYLIFYQNMIFILYLAIDQNERDQGIGSYVLNWCFDHYKDRCFFLNIDEINPKFDDYELRKKRLQFYLKNRFYLTEYFADNIYKGHILSSKKDFHLEQYKEFDQKISHWFFTSVDDIVKMKKDQLL